MTTINILMSVLCAILSNIVAIASSSKSFPQNRINADAEQYFSMKKEGSTIKIKFFLRKCFTLDNTSREDVAVYTEDKNWCNLSKCERC